MKTHKHADGIDYDDHSCSECYGDPKAAAKIQAILDVAGTSLYVPNDKELKEWLPMFEQATSTGEPQYVVVNFNVYRIVDTGITAQDLMAAHQAKDS